MRPFNLTERILYFFLTCMGNRPVQIALPYFIQMQSWSKLSAEMTVAQSVFLSGNMKRAHLESFRSCLAAGIIYAVGNKAIFTWLELQIENVWVCVSGGYVSKPIQCHFLHM